MWWQNGALSFDGVKLFVANGLADNRAVAAQKSTYTLELDYYQITTK